MRLVCLWCKCWKQLEAVRWEAASDRCTPLPNVSWGSSSRWWGLLTAQSVEGLLVIPGISAYFPPLALCSSQLQCGHGPQKWSCYCIGVVALEHNNLRPFKKEKKKITLLVLIQSEVRLKLWRFLGKLTQASMAEQITLRSPWFPTEPFNHQTTTFHLHYLPCKVACQVFENFK